MGGVERKRTREAAAAVPAERVGPAGGERAAEEEEVEEREGEEEEEEEGEGRARLSVAVSPFAALSQCVATVCASAGRVGVRVAGRRSAAAAAAAAVEGNGAGDASRASRREAATGKSCAANAAWRVRHRPRQRAQRLTGGSHTL